MVYLCSLGRGSSFNGSTKICTSSWWWSCSFSTTFRSSEFNILIVRSLEPSFYNLRTLGNVSAVISPKTTFFKSIKGHGCKVIANRLLLVFSSLILVSSPGLSCKSSKDSSLNLGPNMEQFPSSMLPNWIKLLWTWRAIPLPTRLNFLSLYKASPSKSLL